MEFPLLGRPWGIRSDLRARGGMPRVYWEREMKRSKGGYQEGEKLGRVRRRGRSGIGWMGGRKERLISLLSSKAARTSLTYAVWAGS